MNRAQFQPGPDPRRQTKGRPPSITKIQRQIIRELGPCAADLIGNLKPLAISGDPDATMACSHLLAAALSVEPRTSKGHEV